MLCSLGYGLRKIPSMVSITDGDGTGMLDVCLLFGNECWQLPCVLSLLCFLLYTPKVGRRGFFLFVFMFVLASVFDELVGFNKSVNYSIFTSSLLVRKTDEPIDLQVLLTQLDVC